MNIELVASKLTLLLFEGIFKERARLLQSESARSSEAYSI